MDTIPFEMTVMLEGGEYLIKGLFEGEFDPLFKKLTFNIAEVKLEDWPTDEEETVATTLFKQRAEEIARQVGERYLEGRL